MPARRSAVPAVAFAFPWRDAPRSVGRERTATIPGKPFSTGQVAQKWHSEFIVRRKTRLFMSGKK
jgi:hypothetical protein